MAGFMVGLVLFGVVGKAEGDTAWFLLASSRYFYAAPTITLEVKYKPLLPTTSQDTGNTNNSADKIDTVLSDDEGEPVEELEEQTDSDNMVISSGDNDQQKGQQTGGDGIDDRDDNTGLLPHLGRNALIISRLTEKHSLRTEIEVDNITSQDAVFIDVFSFSGDVPPASTSGDWGDTQEDGKAGEGSGTVETADTVFISFENEDRVVKTVRIGIDAEQGGGIDKITVLDGVSAQEPAQSAPQDFQQDSHHSHYVDDSSFRLEQIQSPIIVILPDTDERMYFADGKKLKEQVFSRDYRIEGIKAVRDEVEIRLIEK